MRSRPLLVLTTKRPTTFPQDEKSLLQMLPKIEHYEILSSPSLCEAVRVTACPGGCERAASL